MEKKILFVINDYNKTSLRLIQPFLNKNFKVEMVVPFRFTWYLKLILFLFPESSFTKKIKRRYNDYKKYASPECKLISASLITLLVIIYRDVKKKRFFLSNSFKTLLEVNIIKKIKFKDYQFVFTFDSSALIYLYHARNAAIKTIMELRGNVIEHSLSINDQLNNSFGLKLDTPHSYLNDPDKVQWYGKLKDELLYSDKIVVYSRYQEKQLEKTNFPAANILRIPISSPFTRKKNIKKATGKVNFIYVGNLSYAKGTKYLLQAWDAIVQSGHGNIQLTLIGDIVPEFANELKQLPGNVFVKGFLFHEELAKELDASHVFIMPSCNDSYAVVIPEALSYNIPVICSANVGAADLIKNMQTGIVYDDAFSLEKLTNAILYFIENKEQVEYFSLNISNTDLPISRTEEIEAAEAQIQTLI
jgi:glycosyltransferase involved in cell wall biosynthesis